ncbi:MAG: hypothetical protein CVV21_05590 [Candidatus Goldiibacteriota bacterium HGW-Goldbacteria-1]|jgi:protein-S-isoprenylcysteine O-methyltransferase Ste14|nr:MAG: hypothetical protein CVV21_05590 [Candidatus Goldiibacteriota bacterium HGW-Goldbacteria-1]
MNLQLYTDIIKDIINKSNELYIYNLIWIWLTALIILISVVYKFIEYGAKPYKEKENKPHPVETFSMAAVIVIIFNILQADIGVLETDLTARVAAASYGLILSAAGCFIHVWSKSTLGKYWSNMIEIQEGHKIITAGPYSIVRHPMYSSIILWLIGSSIMFLNYAALILILFIYTPMMIARANAEDKLLKEADPTGFAIHSASVKQLVPKFEGWFSMVLRFALIALFITLVIYGEMTPVRIGIIIAAHVFTGLLMKTPKVGFSYINKSVIILITYMISLFFPHAKWFYFVIILFNIWGLFSNCPCMMIYEKYNRCPCFDLFKKCVRPQK